MKILFFLMWFPCVVFSQNNCRQITAKGLYFLYNKSMYTNGKSFNSYIKNDVDLHIDVDTETEISYEQYERYSQSDITYIGSSKNDIYKIITSMSKISTFENSDIEECSFGFIYFHMTFVTYDYFRICYEFEIEYKDLVDIKDSLNKRDVFSKLLFLRKI